MIQESKAGIKVASLSTTTALLCLSYLKSFKQKVLIVIAA